MKNLSDELTADEVRSLLKLEPHAACGFVRVTIPSGAQVPARPRLVWIPSLHV